MFTHIYTHTQWLWLARPLWSGAAAKSKPKSGTLGVLCLILEPLALSRPCFKIHCGFEEQHSQQQGGQAWKIQTQQERRREKKRPGKCMCSFTFAVVSIFLMLLTHFTVQGRALRTIFKSESERKSCTVTVVCDSIQTTAGLHVAL